MADLTAKRTLVKSPPELWSELSEVERLARHLGAFGEIRITKLEPEHTVAWEGERASGTVSIEPSGWGTKVTLTAQLEGAIDESSPPETAAGVGVEEETEGEAAERAGLGVEVVAAADEPLRAAGEEPKVEESPVAESPPEESPMEEPPLEEPPLEEPPVEEPPVEEAPAGGPVAKEPVVVEPVAEEPVVVEPPAEEPVAVERPVLEPVPVEPIREPISQSEPIAARPRRKRGFLAWLFRQRTSEQAAARPMPAASEPVVEAPAAEEPPVAQTPPAAEEPLAEERPIVEEPRPGKEPPMVGEPVAEEWPVVEEPVAEEWPVGEEPGTEQQPVAETAPAERPAADGTPVPAHEPALDPERAQAVLDGALDALGSAHHRPFSRG